MPFNVAPRLRFPHLVLADGRVVQLIPVRRRLHLVPRRSRCGHDECHRWPEWWRPFRIGRTWGLTAHPDDIHLLHGYRGPATVSVWGVSDTDALVIKLPGVQVVSR